MREGEARPSAGDPLSLGPVEQIWHWKHAPGFLRVSALRGQPERLRSAPWPVRQSHLEQAFIEFGELDCCVIVWSPAGPFLLMVGEPYLLTHRICHAVVDLLEIETGQCGIRLPLRPAPEVNRGSRPSQRT